MQAKKCIQDCFRYCVPSRKPSWISKIAISCWRCSRCCNICSHNLYLHWLPIELNIVVSLHSSHSIWSSREDYFCCPLRKRVFLNDSRTETIHHQDLLMSNLTRYLRSPAPVIMYRIPFEVTNFSKQFLHTK